MRCLLCVRVLEYPYIGVKEWCEQTACNEKEGKQKGEPVATANHTRKVGIRRDNTMNQMVKAHHENKSTKNRRHNYKPEKTSTTETDQEDEGGFGDDSGTTNPVCVGVGETATTVVKSLSSASNRPSVSARYVARLMSHLASHSESTVT